MSTPTQAHHDPHGRTASRPWDIPYEGWRDIAHRVWADLQQHNMSFVAAGVAFFALLALFPALGAIVGIYGLIADPGDVEREAGFLRNVLPPEALNLLREQLRQIASHAAGSLSFGVLLSLLVAVWSTSRGVSSIITALDIVYNQPERRSFTRLTLLSLALTVGAILFVVVALALIVLLPAIFDALGIGGLVTALLNLLAWPLLGLLFIMGLAVIYHYGPCRDQPRWEWVTPGAVFATVLWLMGSGLFSFYVASFGSYNETYGSVGAAVILLTWVYLTSYVVLLGAEVNAEMEHQTGHDTTEGQPKPMGERGAYVADTLGRSSDDE
ncbi:YihY/virulence factor BrkB family protein [Methylomagnum sp.]